MATQNGEGEAEPFHKASVMSRTFLRSATCAAALLLVVHAPAQIELVKDFFPGPTSGNPVTLAELDNYVYIITERGMSLKLWKSDGSEKGTEIVLELPDGRPSQFTKADEYLYFSISTAGLSELWRTDGTPGGTAAVHIGGIYEQLTAWDDAILFADHPINAGELWISRPGVDPFRIGENFAWAPFPIITEITPLGEFLHFVASYKSPGNQIIRTILILEEGSPNLRPVAGDLWPLNLLALRGAVYFSGLSALGNRELWKVEAGVVEHVENLTDKMAAQESSNSRSRAFSIRSPSIHLRP